MKSKTLNKQIDGNHYKDMGLQPWEIIAANKLDYFEGAALKYLLRWRHKDGIIDLDKIIHYIEHIKELALSGHYGTKFIPIPQHSDCTIPKKLFDYSIIFDEDLDIVSKAEEKFHQEFQNQIFGGPYKASHSPKVTRSKVKRTLTSSKHKKGLKHENSKD